MTEIVYVNETPRGVAGRLRRISADDVLTDAMNMVLALLALVFLAPVMIAVATAVFLEGGGPVVFAHRRIGRGGRYFHCFKFRSMAIDAEQRLAELLAQDPLARVEWE